MRGERMADERLPFDQVRAFRDGTWHFVKTVQQALALTYEIPGDDRNPARWHNSEGLLFRALDSRAPADVAAARAAFVAALKDEGWLRDA